MTLEEVLMAGISNNNKLTEQNIQNILNAYKERANKEYYSKVEQNEKNCRRLI